MHHLQLTDHARTRSQQRAIPEVVLESLLSMGKTAHDHRGSCIVYFDHRAKSRLRHLLGESDYRRYENKLDAYAVVGNDGSVVTVGHRTRRIPRS